MKLILVTQRIDFIKKRNEFRDSIDQKLLELIIQSGYLVVQVPNKFFFKEFKKDQANIFFNSWLSRISPDGIVLSGGNNIGDFPERDITELSLLRYAEKLKLPTLGICRGMQMMGKFAGTKLIKVNGHVNKRHKLIGDIDIEVNSFHDWALAECPPEYKLLAKSKDNIIKAIKHKSLPWEGWMWHPERESPFKIYDVDRLKILFK